jgi:hypothetical protein
MLKKAFSLLAFLVILPSLAGQSQANTNLSSYSVFATNSVWVRQNATVTDWWADFWWDLFHDERSGPCP